METKSVLQSRMNEENKILKNINREILKSAKKGEFHYYWDVRELSNFMVKSIITRLEDEGRMVRSKGENFKIIHW